jgi:hypothetical protein
VAGIWDTITGAVKTGERIIEKGATVLATGEKAVDVAVNVTQDPCFLQVVDLVRQLHVAEQPRGGLRGLGSYRVPGRATRGMGYIAMGDVPGIGLCRVVTPLKIYVATRKNPYIIPLAIAGILGVPFFLGYLFGKGGK